MPSSVTGHPVRVAILLAEALGIKAPGALDWTDSAGRLHRVRWNLATTCRCEECWPPRAGDRP